MNIGCWNFGGDWDSTEDNNSAKIVCTAVDMGINFFDVAPVYGWGHSEKVLGKVLKENGLRNKVLIASKGGLLWNEAHETTNNLSKKSLLKEIDSHINRRTNNLCRIIIFCRIPISSKIPTSDTNC